MNPEINAQEPWPPARPRHEQGSNLSRTGTELPFWIPSNCDAPQNEKTPPERGFWCFFGRIWTRPDVQLVP
ncbi:MAG: hypothetical protein KDI60_05840, partial [Xanthomonadales bacterium]|nr:hypothetical protein [Xanthomonadales bacterium]